MQFTWCLRTLRSQAWKACLVSYHTHTHTHYYLYIVYCDRTIYLYTVISYTIHHIHDIYQLRCYFVCTNNRIRSPRLAAFGRIEIRWVREVGKFGPYLRYKDWLRRWKYLHHSQSTHSSLSVSALTVRKENILWELARTRGIRLFN